MQLGLCVYAGCCVYLCECVCVCVSALCASESVKRNDTYAKYQHVLPVPIGKCFPKAWITYIIIIANTIDVNAARCGTKRGAAAYSSVVSAAWTLSVVVAVSAAPVVASTAAPVVGSTGAPVVGSTGAPVVGSTG